MAFRKPSISDALARLAAAEAAFLGHEFLAPVLRGAGVQVCIAGVRCQLRVEPADFEGFGVFAPLSHVMAKQVRSATRAERRKYLELFPDVALNLSRQEGEVWIAVAGSGGSARVHVEGEVPVRLAEDVELFDTVRARFDGSQFWFEEPDARADPGAAAYLRRSLIDGVPPERIERVGLTAQQREAYASNVRHRIAIEEAERRERQERAAHARRVELQRTRHSSEGRLREALGHAGATLRDFADRGAVYRVTYTVDGRQHTSVVNKRTLTVQTAGICLSGQDSNFDLHSLVGVLREGRDRW